MPTTKSFLSGAVIALFMACSFETPLKDTTSDLTRVSLATGGCYGQCPFLAVDLDTSLLYKFYGGDYSEVQGYHVGRFSQESWDTLTRKFDIALYKTYQEPSITMEDGMYFELILEYCDTIERFHIPAIYSLSADSLSEVDHQQNNMLTVLDWLMGTYKRVPLIRTDSFSLRTSIQFPLRIPPPVDLSMTRGGL